ncbi:MAG: ribbon-helix-helix domain-containing protein [Zoogloeaceae bacterium]|jgi:predicted transcriptional regulator|nr:ribbon-helix-helix domain-containing protein [Zoogloeaceae bacterium]
MGAILTARLTPELQSRLDAFSANRHISRSTIVKAALVRYLEEEEHEQDALTVGAAYFGKYASGEGDLSTTYKSRLKQKLRGRQREQTTS